MLIGVEYWTPLVQQLQAMREAGAIGPNDMDLLKITDDVDEAISHIATHTIGHFGVHRRTKPSVLLGERGVPRRET